MKNIVISGGSGALGTAFIDHLTERFPAARIFNLSRQPFDTGKTDIAQTQVEPVQVDYGDDQSLERAAQRVAQSGPVDLMMVTNGILHQGALRPEKSMRALTAENMAAVFAANTIVPALMARHFLPLLHRDRRAVFAALSARVGSISDNHLGGWYSYRASKAALNMIIRTAAIETQRRNPQAIVVGLHPGTVDSALSKPFQANVPREVLFTPERSASCLLAVIDELSATDSGQCFDWQGARIEA